MRTIRRETVKTPTSQVVGVSFYLWGMRRIENYRGCAFFVFLLLSLAATVARMPVRVNHKDTPSVYIHYLC